MATKNATYRIYNGTAWEDVYFKTSAAQVGESTNLKFLRPSTHTVNGQSFFDKDGNAQAITLTGEDIMFDDTDNISTCISDLSGRIYIVSSAYIKSISSTSDADKITLTWTKQDGSTSSVDIPKSISDATETTSGLMSADDKNHLDTMYNVWAADDTNNTLVDKVQEVLSIFDQYPEGSTIVDALAGKLDKTGGTITGDLNMTGSLSMNGHLEVGNSLQVNETGVIEIGDVGLYSRGLHLNASGNKTETCFGFNDVNEPTIVNTDGRRINIATDSLDGDYLSYTFPAYEGTVVLDEDLKNYYTKAEINTKLTNVRQIFEGSTTPSGMRLGDIWIYY